MQPSFDKLNYLVGSADILENLHTVRALPVFSDESMSFLAALSKKLLNDKRTKQYPDLSAFAFWIRKGSLEQMKSAFANARRIGRGVSFHISPSNVPVAFAMSFTAGILAGNACVVRVSNKPYVQVDIITEAVKELFSGEFQEMKPYLQLVRYEHDSEITQALSDLCDIRVIWGGNRTIETIRSAVLPSRAIELAFADRYSLAIIDADKYLHVDFNKIADAFYMDTYYSDQGACSSPRLVFWIGDHIVEAQSHFWKTFEKMAIERYEFRDVQSVDKIDAFCRLAMMHPDVRRSGNGITTRINLPELYPDWTDYRENGGYFFEYSAKSLDELAILLKKPCQTIAYLGINPEDIKRVIFENGVRGADRIVPLGQTMELSLLWDGFNLVESMSRIVDMRAE